MTTIPQMSEKREVGAGRFVAPLVFKFPRKFGVRLSVLLSAVCFTLLLGGETAFGQAKPEIQSVNLQSVSFAAGVVSFDIEIKGSGFGSAAGDPSLVAFINAAGTSVGTIVSKTLISDSKIVVQAQAPIGTTISRVRITTNGQTVEDSNFKLALKAPAPPAAITPFQIKFSTITSPDSPIQTLFVTNESGLFSSNPHRMSVEILPAGAGNATIRGGSNPFNLMVDFVSPPKFEVKGVVVTVYDSGDLDARQVVAISQPFQEKKPAADPNQPTISRVKVTHIQRRFGHGRLLIEGSGFGNYLRPPAMVADQLVQYRECVTGANVGCVAPALGTWPSWSDEIAKSINIALVPRNNSLAVQRSHVLYIDDKMIDLYFEFTQYSGYSLPFRLATATVSIKKPGAKQVQVLKAPGVVATIDGPETYLARSSVGSPMSENLKSSFTVLSNDKANYEFGRGIADNFYVIKLSVINFGDKKVSLPLAAIDAHVDWASGSDGGEKPIYVDSSDPETPVPIEDVSAYFDAYQKQAGKRAKLFNIFEGMTTLMAAFVPIFGPGFKDAHVIFTGGLVPGIKKGIGDLSGQQLQNLTGRSWQNVEVIADHGGSLTKYVFIQRGEQSFNEGKGRSVQTNLRKLILNIRGVEVTGFEVSESSAASSAATPDAPVPE